VAGCWAIGHWGMAMAAPAAASGSAAATADAEAEGPPANAEHDHELSAYVSKYDVWDRNVISMYARFEGLEGYSRIRAKALQIYAFNGRAGMTNIPWFNSKGKRTCFRHRMNDRDSEDTENYYCDLIIKEGLVEGVRSEAVGVPSSSSLEDPIYFVAAASVINGAYMAFERAPDAPNVKFTLSRGIKAQLLDPRSPPDVLSFFKALQNDFSEIFSKKSFKECYNLVTPIEAAWRAHRKSLKGQKGSVADSVATDDAVLPLQQPRSFAGYESSYFNFIEANWKGQFKSWAEFSDAKEFLHKATDLGIYASYED